MKSNEDNEDENVQDVALFGGQFKGKCRNYGMIGCKAQNCKNNIRRNDANQGNSYNGAFYAYCHRSGHLKTNCFKLKINRTETTITVLPVTMRVKTGKTVIPMMSRLQQLQFKNIL